MVIKPMTNPEDFSNNAINDHKGTALSHADIF